VGCADPSGDPCVIVVLAEKDVTLELLLCLVVGAFAFRSAKVEDSSSEALGTIVFDVFEEGFGRAIVVTPVRFGSVPLFLLVDLTSFTERKALLTDIGLAIREIFNQIYETMIRKVLGENVRIWLVFCSFV
jgi:hypothetical protein